jgi:hypothetical protein
MSAKRDEGIRMVSIESPVYIIQQVGMLGQIFRMSLQGNSGKLSL